MNTYSNLSELSKMEGGVWKRSFQDDRRGFSDRLPMQGYRRFQDNRLCFVVIRAPRLLSEIGTRLTVEELVYDEP